MAAIRRNRFKRVAPLRVCWVVRCTIMPISGLDNLILRQVASEHEKSAFPLFDILKADCDNQPTQKSVST